MNYRTLARSLVIAATVAFPFYFLRLSVGPLKFSLFELIVVAAGITFLFSRPPHLRPGPVWPYLFLVAALLGGITSSDHVQALGILKAWFFFPALWFWLIINLFAEGEFLLLSQAVFWPLLLQSVWALIQYFHPLPLLPNQQGNLDLINYFTTGRRVFGFTESPNYLAMYLVPATVLSVPYAQSLVRRYSKVVWGSVLLPAIALGLTGSRAGLLAAGCGLAVLAFQKAGARRRWLQGAIAILSCSAIAGALYLGLHSRPESVSGREEIYHYSFILVKEHPVLGVGLGDFQKNIALAAQHDYVFLKYSLSYAYHPHNIYLAMWLNLGLLGLVTFCLLWGNALLVAYRGTPISRIAGLALLTILIHGLLDTPYFKGDLSAIFWLCLAGVYLTKSTAYKVQST